MKDQIWIVGGYGHVGRTLSLILSKKYPGQVYAAGRSRERAEQFSHETGGKVQPLQLDIHSRIDPRILQRVKLVVMCLDQSDAAFVRACFQTGTHYIDVSAKGSFLQELERWDEEAGQSGATAVLSVGLAPGLTNLMAGHVSRRLDRTDRIEISIMLGLGDRHGKAAIEWTVDNLNTSYEIIRNNRAAVVYSFTEGRRVEFGADLGRKRVYRFPFSDQQTVAGTLAVPTVTTRLGFDSALVTAILAGLRRSGAIRLFKAGWMRRAMVAGIGKLRFGQEHFAVKVEAFGSKSGVNTTVQCLLVGRQQSELTAQVAAFVADAVAGGQFPGGVHHIEQLFELESMEAWLRKEANVELAMART